jgi:curved DNA-binding protein CbpA
MPSPETFLAWAESLATLSYYGVLRVREDATDAQIKAAFHSVALRCHPDRYVEEEDPAVTTAASEVFKRVVEAYTVLAKPKLRAKYAEALKKGKLRIDPDAIEEKPQAPPIRTLEMICKDARAKSFALKADRLISIGKLEEARIQLTNAHQCEPHNDELKERLNVLYEALALEPG